MCRCPDCGKIFTRRNMYNEHRNIHLGLKPFKCDCGASFASNSSLRSHFRVHTGGKSILCTISHKSSLTLFSFIEKPFVCKFCNKAYSHYSDMKRHSYTHTGNYPFSCEFCQKQFAKKSTYKLHMSIHSADKEDTGV